MTQILAVDPGKMTGLAWATFDPALGVTSFKSWERETWPAVDYAAYLIAEGNLDLVVCEAYTITPATLKKTRQYEPLETIGALRYLCRLHRVDFMLQFASAVKPMATNARLASMGWRSPSIGGHADDAARHLLVAAVQLRLVDPAELVDV